MYMRKKLKNDPWARVKISEPPFSFDPFNKELMAKLEHANNALGKVVKDDEDDNKPRSKAIRPSQKTKRSTTSPATGNSAAIRAKGTR